VFEGGIKGQVGRGLPKGFKYVLVKEIELFEWPRMESICNL